MKNNFPSHLRSILLFFFGVGVLEYFVDSGDTPAFLKFPMVSLAVLIWILTIAVFEVSLSALKEMNAKEVSKEDKLKYEALKAEKINSNSQDLWIVFTNSTTLRSILIFFIGAGVLEYFVDSGEPPAFLKYPLVLLALFVLLLAIVVLNVSLKAFKAIDDKVVTAEEKLKYEAIKAEKAHLIPESIWSKLTKTRTLEDEDEIVLNHNYDGIRELDNVLPPWWVYLFYMTIVFALVYLIRFEILNEYNQEEEYIASVELAKTEFEAWKKTAKDYVDVSSVTVLTDISDLEAGKAIFIQNCAVCHKPDAGGSIGPNLTDDKWILGGGVKNIFKTISKGGRPDKGMEAWGKKGLKALDIQQLSSYILSLQGTNPPNAKKEEGEIWEKE